MEVYFRELISEEASLEKLIDDLERVVQGADDFAKAMGVDLDAHPRSEIAQGLRRLQENCRRLMSRMAARARATDKLVRRHPYSFLAAGLLLGLVVGSRLRAGR